MPIVIIQGEIPFGEIRLPFSIAVETNEGEEGVVEFAIPCDPGKGDRGPNLEWVDLLDVPGGWYSAE